MLRYHYLWAFYDQSIFWGYYAELIKLEFGLPKNIRSILAVIPRIVDFSVAHNMGGRLDMDAGDGKSRPSALPIILGKRAAKSLPPMIGKLWKDSLFQTEKANYVLFGTCLGDVGLEAIDDPEKKSIRMRVIHPGEVTRIRQDIYGNPIGITLQRNEIDPSDVNGTQMVNYKEIVDKVGDEVTYQTFRNDAPYQWPGTIGDTWKSKFPFIPMRFVQHINQGFPTGIAEIASAIPKSFELEGQAASMADGNLKAANGPWFLKGATLADRGRNQNPWGADPFGPSTPPPENFYQVRSQQIASRQDMPIIQCADPGASMTPLVYPMPIDGMMKFVQMITDSIGLQYPELEKDVDQASGAASGRALRVARQKTAEKIEERRAAYEEALCGVQSMAMVMGGMQKYPGYEEFSLDSLENGQVAHSIGERPVFGSDPMDMIEIQTGRATTLKTYVEAGFTLRAAMMMMDFQPDDIDTYEALRESAAEVDSKKEKAQIDAMLSQSESAAAAANPAAPVDQQMLPDAANTPSSPDDPGAMN